MLKWKFALQQNILSCLVIRIIYIQLNIVKQVILYKQGNTQIRAHVLDKKHLFRRNWLTTYFACFKKCYSPWNVLLSFLRSLTVRSASVQRALNMRSPFTVLRSPLRCRSSFLKRSLCAHSAFTMRSAIVQGSLTVQVQFISISIRNSEVERSS